jgi:hypothetical protein
MIPLRRLFYLGCLAALLTSFAQAQTVSQTDTSKARSSPGGWAGTEDPKAVAWRAYDAMLIGDDSAIPQLLSVASRWQPLMSPHDTDDPPARKLTAAQREQRDAMTVVLDALIQLKAPVPADTLRNLAPDFGNAVAVILARMPAQESELLAQEFFGSAKTDDTVQYVSAALLALHPPPGFAGKLLADIRVRAKVVALSPGEAIGSGGDGACGGPAPEPEREDWPEMGQYKLSTRMSQGSVLVGGNDPVYVSREESTRYLGNDCTFQWYAPGLGVEQRRALIAQMLGESAEQIPWETDVTSEIEFTSLGGFSGEVLGFIQEQQLMYLDTAKALQERGLLAASEVSQSLPVIELCLDDERRAQPFDQDSDHAGPNDRIQVDLEPISKDAIKLPARVMWSPYTCF